MATGALVEQGRYRAEIPEWVESFLEPERYKSARGGRGSSKSHTFAQMRGYTDGRSPAWLPVWPGRVKSPVVV